MTTKEGEGKYYHSHRRKCLPLGKKTEKGTSNKRGIQGTGSIPKGKTGLPTGVAWSEGGPLIQGIKDEKLAWFVKTRARTMIKKKRRGESETKEQ